jgi:trk system potassium uptake protein TrkH
MVLNYRMIGKMSGAILMILAASMIPPSLVSFYYGETLSALSFIYCIIPMVVLGLLTQRIRLFSHVVRIRDGYAIVALCWLLGSLLGALPFVISGSIPSYIDAFFETVSGFTTTGASILTDIEVLPMGQLFWRSFTHWLGGMGILVFAIALLPALGIGGQQMARAETPGPVLDKITPKMSDSAKILYLIYISITILEVLLLLAGGMSVFDAFVQTFGTMGTGGFSNYNASIAHFNSLYIEIVIGIFMIAAGVNFNLYYDLIKGRWRVFLGDNELRLYLGIIGFSVIVIALNLWFSGTYGSVFQSIRYAFFQTSSIITTTGFASADFDLWPTFSKMILFTLMFIGGCSASTAGSIKVIRILIVAKLIKREMFRRMHPRAVVPVKIDGRPVPSGTVSSIASFVFLYMTLFALGTILISIEDFGFVVSASAVAATLGNVGPGFELVGPVMNYSIFSDASTLLLSFLMLAGRLELFTIILLLSPGFWNPDR